MKRHFTLLIAIMTFMLCGYSLKAQWVNIPFTGFTADVVANGSNSSTSSTSNSVDGTNVFLDGTFSPGFNVCQTTNVWPSDLKINSLTTPGLTYTLQAANVSNSFRVYSGSSGTMTITTPTICTGLKFLAIGGGDSVNFSAKITFTDASFQTFSSLTVPNWCSGISPATNQFYRTARSTSLNCSTNLCQYMYEINLPIDTANQSKSIASITITNPTTAAAIRLHVFALGGNILPVPCSTPLNQPTNLTLTPGSTTTVTGSFTASTGSPSADHYLIVRSTSNTLTQVPVNGQIYTAGSSFGGGKIVAYQYGTTFSDAGLTSSINYYYFVFAANSNCMDTSRYVTINPLTGTTSIFSGVLTSSNLPIIVVNTNNVTIYNDPSNASITPAHMGIIYNGPGVRNYMTDPFNNYNDSIGIRVRGSSSRDFPQLSYKVETMDKSGASLDTVILNMPTENDWILYAPYDDKSCMRDVLAYTLANKSGHWASHTQYCELVLNGQYWGIYVMEEKIKRDASRVNISKLDITDTIGDNVTGGYIFKIDKTTGTGGNDGWNSNYKTAANSTIRFLYDYPSGIDIAPQQATYIAAYVDSFETTLKATNFADPVNGYRKYMDDKSFIDYFIINELSNNVDGLRLSTFLYKNKDSHGGKIVVGPVWDYNIAFGNANYNNGAQYTGWAYQMTESNTGGVPFWWARLIQDTLFKNTLRCRYFDLRKTILSTTSIFNYIDSTANILNEAQARHFAKWQILGVYTWPNPSPYPSTYAGEVSNLKTWIQNRLAWLDANMVGTNSYPTVNLGNDTAICPLQPIILDAGNIECSFLWNTGATSENISVNTAGTYSVTVDKNYGCKTIDSISITLKTIPYAFAGNDTSICQGNNIILNAVGDGSFAYSWNNNVQQGVPFIPINTKYYTVTILGDNGCINRDSLLVTLNPLPSKPTITAIWGMLDTLISSSASGNQWYKDGNILMGENGQKLLVSPFVNGNYSDIVIDVNGCSSSPSDVFNTLASIKETTNTFEFTVYPNPATDKLTIDFPTITALRDLFISIYDIQGQLILFQQINKVKTEVNICSLAKGIYVIKVYNEINTSISKFVKE